MAETKGTQKAGEQETREQTRRAQGEQQSQATQATGRGGTRQRGLARREPFNPSLFNPSLFNPSLWTASPFALMNRFADEMERMFEDFGLGRNWLTPFDRREILPRGLGETREAIWLPEMEIFEREGQIIVRADLPGLAKDDVKVDITDDALIIQGERKHEHEQCDESFCRSERSFGRFSRSIPLPEGIDADNAKANFRDGVLEITIPAPEREQRRRQIEIGEGAGAEKQPRAGAQTTAK